MALANDGSVFSSMIKGELFFMVGLLGRVYRIEIQLVTGPEV